MKRIVLITALALTSGALFAQQQIGNGDMENWANDDEPDNWNSFLTADGSFAFAASDQCDESTDTRPGSAGSYSCRIFSTSTFGIIANGNVTLGQVQMNSATPTAASNHNKTITGDSDFSQVLTDTPDSIVFWAKFIPNGGSGNARMKATIHTDYDYRDPEDAASSAEVVASAVVNYPTTNGWERFAVAFDYSGPASLNDYLLVTFTTNETAGGGDAGDEVFIDDIQLIYSDVSVSELDPTAVSVSMDNTSNTIIISSIDELNGDYTVYNMMGQVLQTGGVVSNIAFDANPGVYFVHIATDNKVYKFEILKN
ncbi:MAG: hypothetical protein ACJA0U_000223 [Salibacteraceae bacterium]|jgi:hypothetical protein